MNNPENDTFNSLPLIEFDNKKEWYVEWFDSPFYPLLYHNRDDEEAKVFIQSLDRLIKNNLKKGDLPLKILDLACGRGRHSRVLHSLGYHVTAIDLSPNSILEAKKFSESNLDYLVGDMRELNFSNEFNCVVNLFTSFGYFNEDNENLSVLRGAYNSLKNGGIIIIDYLNSDWIIGKMKNSNQESIFEERDEIRFSINKFIDGKHIVKKIKVTHKSIRGNEKIFEEKIRLFTENDFKTLLELSKFSLVNFFGLIDNVIVPITSENSIISERLIIVAKKDIE